MVSRLPFSNSASSAGELPKENPYEDVDLKNRRAGRKSQQLSENSLESLHRMWNPQDRKYNNPPMQVMQFWPRQSEGLSSRDGVSFLLCSRPGHVETAVDN